MEQDRQGINKLIVKATSAAFVIYIVGTALKFLQAVVLARWMSEAAFGEYAFAFTWANLLAVLACLGLTTASLRFIPEYLEKKNGSLLRGYLIFAPATVLLLGLLLGGLGLGFLYFVGPKDVSIEALAFGALLVPLLGVLNLGTEMIKGFKRVISALLPIMVLFPFFVIAASFLFLNTGASLSGSNVLLIVVGSCLLSVVIQWLLAVKDLPAEIKTVKATFVKSTWIKVALPLLMIAVAYRILVEADILMVTWFLGAEVGGQYLIASRAALLVSFPLIAVNTIVAPMIASLYVQNNKREMQRLSVLSARISFACSLAIVLVLFFGGELILKLFFGEAFIVGYVPMLIIAGGHLMNAFTGSVTYLVSLTGRERKSAQIYSVCAGLNILLNIFLIPYLGMNGAACGTVATLVLWNVAMYFVAGKELGIHSHALASIESRE